MAEVHKTTVTTEQNGTSKKVPLDRITKVPLTKGTEEHDGELSRVDEREYPVDGIIEHQDEPYGTRTYRVKWFRYNQSHHKF